MTSQTDIEALPKFTDETGRDWLLRVDVTAIKHVRHALDVDLGDLGKVADNLLAMANDPVLLCNVLFVLCEGQAKDHNITDEDFGRLLAGDVIFEATMALEEAIIDFFPRTKRSLLQRLQKKVYRAQEMGEELVTEKLDDKDLDKKMRADMKEKMDQVIQTGLTSDDPQKLQEGM